MNQKLIKGPIKGYKITNDDMTCRNYQFEIGKLHTLDNDRPLEMCGNGFHFCPHPSGVWSYYESGRVFECEAYDVLDTPFEPGADRKMVCRSIKIGKEVAVAGHGNTGYRNTGDRNTGYGNTGDRNTGDGNTGYRNTGDGNTGDWNTGDGNTGDWNTGDGNTGHRNTGDGNTGHRNTGDGNTGDWNTGDGNVGGYHSGFFNVKPEPIIIFDRETNLTRDDLPHNEICRLARMLLSDEPFDYTRWGAIPNATAKKVKALHEAHIAARRKGGKE